MKVSPAEPPSDSSHAPKIIFASIDAAIAREMEPAFAAAGCAVISNSSAFRMAPNVPLVLPEVNADHLHLIEEQSWRKESGGYIVTNSNCTAMGPVLALKPLVDRFGVEQIFATSMQAISGAGYPGVPSWDILDNVIPYIGGEEEKMEAETLKLLGKLEGHTVKPLGARMSASCNRVAVVDGHTVTVSVKLSKPATHEQILAAWAKFQPLRGQNLPMAPAQPVEYATQDDRPQPRLDRNRGNGMAVTVGRLLAVAACWTGSLRYAGRTTRFRGSGGGDDFECRVELLASLGKLEPIRPLLRRRGDDHKATRDIGSGTGCMNPVLKGHGFSRAA